VIVRLADRLRHLHLAGFYTEEMREHGHRQGFRAVTFSGRTTVLAHVSFKSRSRVGRYGVNIAAFEDVVLPELRRPCDVTFIDEIGKMECFSFPFVAAVRELLDGTTPIVATVAGKGGGFIAEVKTRTDVEVREVTHSNRDELPRLLAERSA